MAITTHEKIRLEAGFQHRFTRAAFQNAPGSGATTFYVTSDDQVKIVPNFSTGTTVAGVSDVQVWTGLSGLPGSSRLAVSSIDVDTGAVVLSVAPASGSSLTINYASSPITSLDVEEQRKQAESIVNQRLSLCYDLPISPTPSLVVSLATRLSAALLLIRNYGTGYRDTAADGYALYDKLMGTNEQIRGRGSNQYPLEVGEIGLLCSAGHQLVDDDGVIIPRNDDDDVSGSDSYVAGGRVRGVLYDITEEQFRYKEPQSQADTEQPGSANNSSYPIQG